MKVVVQGLGKKSQRAPPDQGFVISCDLAKFACSVYLSYLLKLATAFKIRPTPVKVAVTTGFSVMPPDTAALIINLPAERLQTKFFFENHGTAFHIQNASCGNTRINLSFF